SFAARVSGQTESHTWPVPGPTDRSGPVLTTLVPIVGMRMPKPVTM
ncbi:hypothetical protein A2U01_0064824, partial [Trifolium medium]|nr:hypothetical protein [Trifolium medium]